MSNTHSSDPETLYRECKKNPGHRDFFSVKDYNGEGLPQDYQNDPDLLQHVNDQVEVTALLMVKGPSENRLEYYSKTGDKNPFSHIDDKDDVIFGSGWLYQVSKYKPAGCPCPECQLSGSPHKGWAKVSINTAAHIVFDETEGRRTECYFDYDKKEEGGYKSCVSLNNAVEVVSSPVADKSLVIFISHDADLSEMLLKTSSRHNKGVRDLQQKYKDPAAAVDSDVDLTTKTAQLEKRLKKLMNNLLLILQKLKLKTVMSNSHLLLNILDSLSEAVGKTLEGLKENRRYDLPSYKRDYTFTVWSENQVRQVGHVLFKDGTRPCNFETFTPDHSLAIIVSHPHGCHKKITVGQVIEKRSGGLEQFRYNQYSYNTPTCPGSSGAPVFITSHSLGVSVHTHSLFDFHPQHDVQLNESALNFDG